MNVTASERELRTFRAFAARGPLKIVPDSIQSMAAPAPDIRCDIESGERIAFELVELIDEDYARDINTLFRTLQLLRDLPERLPKGLRHSLEEACGGGAFISFDFAERLPLQEREGAAVDARRWLLGRTQPIEDHNEVEGDLRARMRTLHVHPWRWELHFDSSSYTRLGDPTVDRLRDKFGKTYKTAHPLELLMHTEVDLLLPDSVWRPTVEPFVQTNVSASPFRRVWLFKAGAGTINYIYPPL